MLIFLASVALGVNSLESLVDDVGCHMVTLLTLLWLTMMLEMWWPGEQLMGWRGRAPSLSLTGHHHCHPPVTSPHSSPQSLLGRQPVNITDTSDKAAWDTTL